MKQKQQVEQLLYQGILHTQMTQIADVTEEMLLDGEVMFCEKLNSKLTEWLMTTEEICGDLVESQEMRLKNLKTNLLIVEFGGTNGTDN